MAANSKYIANKMSTAILISVVISILSYQVPIIINPIMAGNCISNYAVAMTALAAPVLEWCYALIFLFAVGESYIIAEYISVNDVHEARAHFSVAISSTFFIMSVLAFSLILFREQIAIYLSNDSQEITELLSEFLSSQAWTFIPLGLSFAIEYNLRAEGKLKYTAGTNILFSILYVVFGLVFIRVLKTGIHSFALASIASNIIIIAADCFYIKKESILRFVRVGKRYLEYLKKNLLKGFPIMADDILTIVFFFLNNMMIVTYSSPEDSVVWGISCVFFSIAMTIGTVFTESSLSLGLSLNSGKDYRGCRQMITKYRTIISTITVLAITTVLVFPGIIIRLFGGTASEESITHLSLAIPLMIIFSLLIFEITNYYLLNQSKKYMAYILASYMGPVLMSYVAFIITPELFWYSLSGSAIMSIIFILIFRRDVNRQFNALYEDIISVEQSIPYDMAAIGPAMDIVLNFLKDNNIAESQINSVLHCVDELSYNIIKHGTEKVKNKSFGLMAVISGNGLRMTFKYDGIPFNPIIKFNDNGSNEICRKEKMQLALRLFNKYAISPSYSYSYGINIVSMTIPNRK